MTWTNVRFYNPTNTRRLDTSVAMTLLVVEAETFSVAMRTDTMRIDYADHRRQEGALVAWVPEILSDKLVADKFLYYIDPVDDTEIPLKIDRCRPDGTPIDPDVAASTSSDAAWSAKVAAAKDERMRAQRIRTIRVRYDLQPQHLRLSLHDGTLKPIATGLEDQARMRVTGSFRATTHQPRDQLYQLRNSVDLYLEFNTNNMHDQADLHGVKFYAPGGGSKPLKGYIVPEKTGQLGIQSCCFRKTDECLRDRSEGFATCRAMSRFNMAAGFAPLATDFSDRKRKAVDDKMEAQRRQVAKLHEQQLSRLCEPYREGRVRSIPPPPPSRASNRERCLTRHMTARAPHPQCVIVGCMGRHRQAEYTSTIPCASSRQPPLGGPCLLDPCPYLNHVPRT